MKKKILLTGLIIAVMMLFAACEDAVTVKMNIHFETNGGTAIESLEVVDVSNIEMPKNPTREGYDFTNWFFDAELTSPVTVSSILEMPLVNDITFYAGWKARILNISLDKSELTLIEGDTGKINASSKKSDSTDAAVEFSSSDNSVAVVDGDGNIEAVGAGSATIKATSGTFSAECVVKVMERNAVFIHNDEELTTALDNIAAGQKWYVYKNTYAQDITLNTTISIEGIENPVFTGKILVNAGDVVMKGLSVSHTYIGEKNDNFGGVLRHQWGDCMFYITGENFTFTDGLIERTSFVTVDYGFIIYYANTQGALTLTNTKLSGPCLLLSDTDNPYAVVEQDSPSLVGVKESTENWLYMDDCISETNGYLIFNRAYNAVIKNCTVRGNLSGRGYMLMNSTSCNDVTIEGCTISEMESLALLIGGNKVTVKNNVFRNIKSRAISAGEYSWNSIQEIIIENNMFDMAMSGRGVYTASHAVIRNNTFINQKSTNAANAYCIRNATTDSTLYVEGNAYLNCNTPLFMGNVEEIAQSAR